MAVNVTLTNASNQTVTGSDETDTVTLNGAGSGLYIDLLGAGDTAIATGATYTDSTVLGGGGADAIKNFGDRSVLFGGAGVDTFTIAQAAKNVTVFGGQDADVFNVTAGTSLLLFGNLGDETISLATGVTGNNTVFGGQGIDTLTGSKDGVDFLSGDLGNDVLTATSANGSALFGGAGDDKFDSSGAKASIFGGQGNDIIGNAAAITGDAAYIFGNKGVDTVLIGAAATRATVFGGQDNDTITSQATATTGSKNYLSGDLGNDTLVAADYRTTLVGGAGFDTFNITGADAGTGGEAITIGDFATGVDSLLTGKGAATAANFTSLSAAGGFTEAQAAATKNAGLVGGTGYVFVAGSTDGFLFHVTGGAVDVSSVLTGRNTTTAVAATDIIG